MIKKSHNFKSIEGFTFLEILVAVSIFSLIALVLTKVFTVSMRTVDALENFSYESKQIDIFMTNLTRMLNRIYLYPAFVYQDVKGYEHLGSNYKLSLKCPLYIEKSRGFSGGTEVLRFIQYNPDRTDDLLYGLTVVEIKVKMDLGKKSIYFSWIPVFFNEYINKDVVGLTQSKEYLLLDDIETFKVLVINLNSEWKEEFSCNLEEGKSKSNDLGNGGEGKEGQTQILIPQFIKIVIEKKTDNAQLQEFSKVVKLY